MPDLNTPAKGAARKPSSATAGSISLKKSSKPDPGSSGPNQVTPPPISPASHTSDDDTKTDPKDKEKDNDSSASISPSTTTQTGNQSNQPQTPLQNNQWGTAPSAPPPGGPQQTTPSPGFNDNYDDFDDGFGDPFTGGGFGGGFGGDFGGGGSYGSNFGSSPGSPYSKPGRTSFGSSTGPARLTPEERVKMIEKVYEEILCRKPDTRDINYYKYSTLSENEIRKQLINSAEHKDMVQKGREYSAMKDRAEQLETRVRILEGQIKDQIEEFRELSNLLKEKNQYIAELRNAAHAHPDPQSDQLTQERPIHPQYDEEPVTPTPTPTPTSTSTPTQPTSDQQQPAPPIETTPDQPEMKVSPDIPPAMSDPFEEKMEQIKHIFTDTLQNGPEAPPPRQGDSTQSHSKKPSIKGILGRFFQTPTS